MHRVLCIDECEESLHALCFSLTGVFDLNVYSDPHRALVEARNLQPDAVVVDPVFNNGDIETPDYLARLKNLPSRPCVIVLRRHLPPWLIDTLRRSGADAFLSKPWDDCWLRHKLSFEISVARSRAEAAAEAGPEYTLMVAGPPSVASSPPVSRAHPHPVFKALHGSSPQMKRVREVLSFFSAEDKPVLIRGETGTGKTVAARLLHRASHRYRKPWVVRNVAAIPDSLAYAELFGCEHGAFTGATSRKGCVAEAEGGTLFLDEIGDASPDLQMTLLRFLDSGCYYPLGADCLQQANVRLVCATNRPLEAMVRNRSFRKDLWFRLRVFSLELPSLDQRRADIPELIHHWCREAGVAPEDFGPEVIPWLSARHWEGNVRELFNVLERFRILVQIKGRQPHMCDLEQVANEGWVSEFV